MSDTSFIRNLAGLANAWVDTKRRNLQTGTPKTYAESGGSKRKFSWDGQQITRSELQEVKQIRESGGLIARLVHAKALLTFGTGVEFHVEGNDETSQLIEGEELTLEEWLIETFNDINELVLDVGEDGIWYPYGAVETVETRAGDFSHIEPIEPWTIIPETDERGRITAWEQEIKSGMGTYSEVFDPEDITHFVINKSSARDKTGISEVLRSKQEIEAYRRNQDAMRNAIEMHGFPEWHVQAGVSGASPVDDQDLRMIINMIERTSSEGDTVTATGPDVEFNRLDPGEIKLQEITSNDLQKLALALGVPIEAVDFGSEGLGSGEQSKVRRAILELDIQATQRAYMNQWVTKLIRPIIKDYSPFDHTQNLEMRLQDPLTSVTDMADLINKIGEYMETNEAREKLDLPKKDDLEGEYGAPGDGDDDPMDGFFTEQVNTELEKRGLGDTDFRCLGGIESEVIQTAPEFDQPLLALHQRLWDADVDTRLLDIPTGSATPEFVKDHIREAIMGGAIFSDFDSVPSGELMQLREYMTETLESDGWTIDGLADQLEQLPGVEPSNARTIARTETASVLNTAREDAYEEQGQEDDLFYWSGNLDNRTTEACRWLINETNPFEGGDPVPLDELKDLIEEAPTHDPDMDNNLARPDNFVVHPSERKTFIRAPPEE